MAVIGKINLTQTEQGELLSWLRSMKMDYRYVLRAKIILMCAEGSKYIKRAQIKTT